MKWIFVALFGLGSAGALAMAFTADTQRNVVKRSAPAVALREFPAMTVGAPAPAKPADAVAAKAEPEKAPEAVAKAEPEKAPEPVAKAEPAKAPEPVAKAEPPPAKPAPAPAPAKPEPAKPAPVAAKPAPPPAEKPAAPPPAEKPAAAAAPAEGLLNLRASDTADVYLDGKKLGGSPLLGIKARAGAHKVRFDCYDAAGNTIAGPAQTVTVKADSETDVEFPCPTE